MTRLTLAALLLAAAGPAAAQSPEAQRWWAHVAELGSDKYEGRFTGTPGYERAAAYVAERFKELGIQPVGTEGYLQPVRFVEQRVVPERSRLQLAAGKGGQAVAIGEDVLLGTRVPQPEAVDAPLVFVGYGLHMPEAGHDDFAGQDLKGKIAVYLSGGPGDLPAALKAHASSSAVRYGALQRAGAVGAISLSNPRTTDVPWDRSRLLAAQPGMYLFDASQQDVKGTLFTAGWNPAAADKLFAGSGHSFEELTKLADEGKALPRFDLGKRMRGVVTTETAERVSSNVLGLLPGSDPKLKDEVVVLTAHLDGLGIGEPIAGDRIYNGAMDNATGVSTLIETARALTAGGERPKRSILLAAVTGEERGLLGSRYLAANPPVAKENVAANVNMDMYLPLYPLTALTVLGMDESTLGRPVAAVAARHKLGLEPDPEPDRNLFIRSDQYSFIREGVPALALKFATPPGSEAAKLQKAWLTNRYHAPSDDLQQPFDREAAARFNAYTADLVRAIANMPERPAWDADSFFVRFAPGQRAAAGR